MQKCPFAFVRFDDIEEAKRVVARLNGNYWRGRKLFLTFSKFRRQGRNNEGSRITRRGEYTSMKTCLISFESAAARDEAVSSIELLEVFDEVRPHWDYFSSHSRRILLEVMGLPVQVWCEATFSNIAKLWGKLILMDDRTEEAMSFSVARFLVDSFEWELINEWVTIKFEEKKFEVHVREVGSEIYTLQAHPSDNNESDGTICCKGNVAGGGNENVGGGQQLSEFSNRWHYPYFRGCIETDLGNMKGVNDDHACGGGLGLNSNNDEGSETRMLSNIEGALIGINPMSDVLMDQMGYCAVGGIGLQIPNYANGLSVHGEKKKEGSNDIDDSISISSSSCPYPLGFGPCSSSNLVHQVNPTHDRKNEDLG
ncbi:hypothetical protein PIB30_090067, partial [Stylosanthes scabra]|nr:hypothetical protein [Stylosanthes scabra]